MSTHNAVIKSLLDDARNTAYTQRHSSACLPEHSFNKIHHLFDAKPHPWPSQHHNTDVLNCIFRSAMNSFQTFDFCLFPFFFLGVEIFHLTSEGYCYIHFSVYNFMIKIKLHKRRSCIGYQKDSGTPSDTASSFWWWRSGPWPGAVGRQHQEGDRETTVCPEGGRGAPTGRWSEAACVSS